MTIQLGDIRHFTETETLKILSRGSEAINYRILQLLPAGTNRVRREVNLSKMPFYRRVRLLADAGLVEHDKREAVLRRTELGNRLLELVELIEKTAESQVETIVKKDDPLFRQRKGARRSRPDG
ncbi:MAG TPA: hypothetical protein VF944_02740 [Candidatus Bathyarchaeia archaeon]